MGWQARCVIGRDSQPALQRGAQAGRGVLSFSPAPHIENRGDPERFERPDVEIARHREIAGTEQTSLGYGLSRCRGRSAEITETQHLLELQRCRHRRHDRPILSPFTSMPAPTLSHVSGVTPSALSSAFWTFSVGVRGNAATKRM